MSRSPIVTRFPRYHDRSPSVSSRDSPVRSNSAYDLQDLAPSPSASPSASPSDGLLGPLSLPLSTARPSEARHTDENTNTDTNTPGAFRSKAPSSPEATAPEMPLFAGPPAPISNSILIPGPGSRRITPAGSPSSGRTLRAGLDTIKSVIFDPNTKAAPPRPDSVWRGLVRQESVIEAELQNCLDMQSLGLNSGGAASSLPDTSSGMLVDSTLGSGGSTTPTGTFYSSRSQMMASIDPPVRNTVRGDVVPVRQPPAAKQRPGIKAARRGLVRSIDALVNLKAEEDGHVTLELARRKTALAKLHSLENRKTHIVEELRALGNDDEEPLGNKLRKMVAQKDDLESEIKELEERLVGMRSRARCLDERIENVRNQREAGLSGFRGALHQVERDIASMVKSPPVDPLDPEILRRAQSPDGTPLEPPSEGVEVLRMVPRRRTPAMVQAWWEAEIRGLESKQAAVRRDREALEAGGRMWREAVAVVASFEQGLRNMASAATERGDLDAAMRSQLPKMRQVIQKLQDYASMAEDKGWTLLICAVGAELDAFRKAEDVVRQNFGLEDRASTPVGPSSGSPLPGEPTRDLGRRDSEGSNHVPPHLISAHANDQPFAPSMSRMSSENEVPPSLLAELQHD